MAKVFAIFGCCGNVASVPKTKFICYSCIFYFGHACPKLTIALIPLLTDKFTTQNLSNTYAFLVYGHVDILWTYQGAKIKKKNFLS